MWDASTQFYWEEGTQGSLLQHDPLTSEFCQIEEGEMPFAQTASRHHFRKHSKQLCFSSPAPALEAKRPVQAALGTEAQTPEDAIQPPALVFLGLYLLWELWGEDSQRTKTC